MTDKKAKRTWVEGQNAIICECGQTTIYSENSSRAECIGCGEVYYKVHEFVTRTSDTMKEYGMDFPGAWDLMPPLMGSSVALAWAPQPMVQPIMSLELNSGGSTMWREPDEE